MIPRMADRRGSDRTAAAPRLSEKPRRIARMHDNPTFRVFRHP
ncbi:hypothetical protein IL54_2379 [Sphingobium sp. ba1]|jgi:hypothetical protein|nr:hypothetical protein IL54_2379 [Sphingobium sp. ba1]